MVSLKGEKKEKKRRRRREKEAEWRMMMKTSHSPSLNKREAQGTHTQKKRFPGRQARRRRRGKTGKKNLWVI